MMYHQYEFNLPTTLTLIRLILSPIILPLLLVFLLPYNLLPLNLFLATLFAAFGLTDFFDGYFARKFDQVTSLGRLLDPVADKLLVSSTLIALVAAGQFWFYWAVIWIAREFFVMGLRQRAAEQQLILHVSGCAKIKTAAQLICLTFVILNPMHGRGLFDCAGWNVTELLLILAATTLTITSAMRYYYAYVKQCAIASVFTHEELDDQS